jgi:hypothetical protein
VFEQEADEDMVEAVRQKREVTDIGLPEGHVPAAFPIRPLFCLPERFRRDVNGYEFRPRAVLCEDYGLGANPACCFEHPAPGRVADIVVEKVCQPGRLVGESLRFAV